MGEFPEWIKKEVRRKGGYKCCICQEPFVLEVHHVIPVEYGGPDTIENAAPLCPNCHDKFGNDPDKRKRIFEIRDWWYERVAEMFGPARISGDSIDQLTEEVVKWRKGRSTFEGEVKPILEDISKRVIELATTPSTASEALTGVYALAVPRRWGSVTCEKCHNLVDFGNYCPICGSKLEATNPVNPKIQET